jgi:hypothetical protein
MNDSIVYEKERAEMDYLLSKGYVITKVNEHLNGAIVEFEDPQGELPKEVLNITNADARKYFSCIIRRQKSEKNQT